MLDYFLCKNALNWVGSSVTLSIRRYYIRQLHSIVCSVSVSVSMCDSAQYKVC